MAFSFVNLLLPDETSVTFNSTFPERKPSLSKSSSLYDLSDVVYSAKSSSLYDLSESTHESSFCCVSLLPWKDITFELEHNKPVCLS